MSEHGELSKEGDRQRKESSNTAPPIVAGPVVAKEEVQLKADPNPSSERTIAPSTTGGADIQKVGRRRNNNNLRLDTVTDVSPELHPTIGDSDAEERLPGPKDLSRPKPVTFLLPPVQTERQRSPRSEREGPQEKPIVDVLDVGLDGVSGDSDLGLEGRLESSIYVPSEAGGEATTTTNSRGVGDRSLTDSPPLSRKNSTFFSFQPPSILSRRRSFIATPAPDGSVTPQVTPVSRVLHREPNYQFNIRPKRLQYHRLLNDFFRSLFIYTPDWLPRGSDVAATFNIASSTITIEVLGMPTATADAGTYLLIPLAIYVLICNLFTLYVSCRCVHLTHLHSYELLAKHVFGQRWVQHLVEVVLIVNCVGTMVAFIVVVGDIGGAVASAFLTFAVPIGVLRVFSQILCFALLMFPLSLLGTLSALKYASVVGMLSIVVLTVAVTVHGFRFGDLRNLSPTIGTPSNLIRSFPLLFFAFTNQVNGIEIYGELPMETRSPGGFLRCVLVAVAGVFCSYVLVGYFGLMEFGAAVQGNILNNYDVTADVLLTCAFLGILIKTVLTYPLLVFPAREALFHLYGVEKMEDVGIRTWVGSTFIVGVFVLFLGILIPNIIVLFGLIGAICASFFAFILPSLLGLSFKKYWADRSSWWAIAERVFMVVTLVTGVFCAVAGSYLAIVDLFYAPASSTTVSPPVPSPWAAAPLVPSPAPGQSSGSLSSSGGT
jgi:amino acid permease